jgi:NADH dehydrogenase (ubiquinone) 1 alpha subcomplex subunit 9
MLDSLCCAQIVLSIVAALKFEDLGVMPHKLKGYPTEYLISYRKGGPAFGSTVSEKMRNSEV